MTLLLITFLERGKVVIADSSFCYSAVWQSLFNKFFVYFFQTQILKGLLGLVYFVCFVVPLGYETNYTHP